MHGLMNASLPTLLGGAIASLVLLASMAGADSIRAVDHGAKGDAGSNGES